jgi:DNA-binding NarL/FixJ family response regulator
MGEGLGPMSHDARVLIADDDAATRLGVRGSLAGRGFEIVGEATDAGAAVRLALSLGPDVCLLAVKMPGDGIRAAAAISATLPDARVVMLSVSASDEDLFAALRAGACGYLLKDTPPERLAFALRGALNGEAALPRHLTARLIEEFRARVGRRRLAVDGRQLELSEREWEVLELLRENRSTKEIAERLWISPVTVRRHVQAILAKLQVSNRSEALARLGA